jgi:hypothetical protein
MNSNLLQVARFYLTFLAKVLINIRNFRLLFFNDKWYVTEEDIKPEDMKALIEATHLKNSEKLKRDINRAKALIGRNKTDFNDILREPIPEDVQIFVWNRDGGKCVKCGSNINLEFDHIIPFSKGGNNTARNIQLLCETCNRSKGASIGS